MKKITTKEIECLIRMATEISQQKMIWTIGHSNRTLEDFLRILQVYGIKILVDVRAFPSSRKFPHFNKEHLLDELKKIDINYVHLSSLGGKRKPLANSKNTNWLNPSFRGYADYMETDEFKNGINELTSLSVLNKSVIMCAEVLWWQCHRALVADYLKAEGNSVIHILSATKTNDHRYSSPAWIENGKLSYQGVDLT